MKTTYQSRILRGSIILAAAILGAAQLSADVVETTGGARIVGKVVKIDDGSVVVDTDYAGTITIKQASVTAITTDNPVAIRLASGTRLEGRVSGTADAIGIMSKDGEIKTTIAGIAASWEAGGKDPQIVALERRWAFEAGVDITGKSGNKSQLGTALSFRATLAGPSDTLIFYTGYDRQETDSQKSADQFKAGVDYTSNFAGKYSWYVRDEGGFDRIKDIQFYNVAAAGLGYDFVKEAKQTLTGRAGFSFRNENYRDPLTEDVNAAGLDFGLAHTYNGENWSLVSRVSFVPAFSDFGNYRLTQESFLELPLANPRWKLRFGLSNDYNSRPSVGLEKLDTTYFSRLVLSWK
jgi:Protein of unknown function, DUF481